MRLSINDYLYKPPTLYGLLLIFLIRDRSVTIILVFLCSVIHGKSIWLNNLMGSWDEIVYMFQGTTKIMHNAIHLDGVLEWKQKDLKKLSIMYAMLYWQRVKFIGIMAFAMNFKPFSLFFFFTLTSTWVNCPILRSTF